MKARATRTRIASSRVRPTNLIEASNNISDSSWAKLGGSSASGNVISFQAGQNGVAEQYISPIGGTGSKTITVAALVSTVSGTTSIRLKNGHGSVVDNFSSDFQVTQTPAFIAFTITNSSAGGNGVQVPGIATNSARNSSPVIVHSAFVGVGAFTAQDFIDHGGFQLTY